MEFLLLGALEVRDRGRSVPQPPPKERALLALLLLNANRLVTTDEIVDALWGETPPKTALDSLHNLVLKLRRRVGRDLVVRRSTGYVLEVEPWRIDAHRFRTLVAEAQGAEPAARVATLRQALALWRGPALADLAFEPFADRAAAALDELRATAGEELADAELALGRHAELVPELETLIARNPLRERLRGQLMLALYRSGRQADALAAYDSARRMLLDELGLEPSPALRALQTAILRQDPRLLTPGPPAAAAEAARRRTVTVVAVETGVAAADPERLQAELARANAVVRAAVERHEGTLQGGAGVEVLAVFGAAAAHEDDELRALRAAAEIRDALPAARIGVDTGAAVTGPGEPGLVGAVVTAARTLARAAPTGAVAVGDATAAATRDAATIEDGQLLDVSADAPVPARRLDAPLRGRGAELEALVAEFEQSRDERSCRLVTVVGDAGIGKTRLARELAACLAPDARVVVGRCTPYGEGAAYLPLAEVVEAAAGSHGADEIAAVVAGDAEAGLVTRRVAELIGASAEPASAGEAHWAVRRFLEALARRRPLVVVLEDVHWAEPALLELVEYLGRWSDDAPILLLCLARPDLLERRPDWAAAPAPGTRLPLGPLAKAETRELVRALPQAADVAKRVLGRVVEVAEGNPLYAEQLLAFAAEGGDLARVPRAVEALLASRLDRLAPDERDVLERAAVLGREFDLAGVAVLDGAGDDRRALADLCRRGLLHPDGPSFTFHHVLVRDVAYEGIPMERRADLHERAAMWLDRQPESPDEVVGYHLEQAHLCLSAVARDDRRARALALDGGTRLAGAGIRAHQRGDSAGAANLLGRAAALLPRRDVVAGDLLCERAIALWTTGDTDTAAGEFDRAVRGAEAERDRRADLRAQVELANFRLHTDPEGRADELLALAAEAIPLFEQLGDHRGLARTWLHSGTVHGTLHSNNTARLAAAEEALLHYRSTGWSPSSCMRQIANALLLGPTPVPEALERCRRMLDDAATDRAARAHVLAAVGGLEGLGGGFDAAREAIGASVSLYQELGYELSVTTSGLWILGRVEVLAGELEAAERAFRTCCEAFERRGNRGALATVAAELGAVLWTRGERAEAERWVATSRELAASDDLTAQYRWRPVLARIAARRGDVDEAVALAEEAVALAGQTDALTARGETLVALAEVLRAAHRPADAVAALEAAVALFERKGNVVGAQAARATLNEAVLA